MRVALLLAVAGALALAVLSLAVFSSAASGPTYNRDVAPILDAKCASCHRLGGVAPFALATPPEAKAHAARIVQMTKAGLMPPRIPAGDPAAVIGPAKRRVRREGRATLR